METYAVLFFVLLLAFLYSSVGHGGASGYLGLMVLMGVSTSVMKPAALILNVIVSSIAAIQFYNAGYFRKQLFFPFIILSVPCAFIGAKIPLSDPVYKIILGVCLLISVLRMLMMYNKNNIDKKPLNLAAALIIGAGIGLISGMIGIGGGILLSPLVLLFRWADYKEAAAVSAPFILVNSISGLAGLWSGGVKLPPEIIAWVTVAAVGGIAGSYWGSKKFNTVALKYLLSAVLVIAAVKLFIS